MTSVESNEAPFLTTDYLQILGRDGFIMMIVAIFLVTILLVCTVALIVWYACKGKEAEMKNAEYFDDAFEPQLGVKVKADHNVIHRPNVQRTILPPNVSSSQTSNEHSPKSQVTDVNGASGSDGSGTLPRQPTLGYSAYDDESTLAV